MLGRSAWAKITRAATFGGMFHQQVNVIVLAIYFFDLTLQKDRYERDKKKLDYAGLCKLLTE